MISKWLKLFTSFSSTLLASSLVLSACAASRMAAPSREAVSVEKPVGVAPSAPQNLAGAPRATQAPAPQYSASSSDQAGKRLVIKNASLTLVVGDPVKSMENISRMADEMGGFVVTANQYQQELSNGAKVPHASITIRIPAEKLNDALTRIKSESQQAPINENINSQDVTSEYTDLQSRLRNLESTEVQLTKIMESAYKTEDVLTVYNQLAQVREQIEVVKGQIQFYEQSAALSAVSVEMLANEAVQPLTIGGWQPVGVVKSAIQALINALKFLVNAVIWVVIFFVPVALVIYILFILPFSLLWRALRRRRSKSKAPQTPPQEPAG
jgi:hypothetical protein